MVNSCTGKMGHATAEAVIRAGLPLIPFSFTGRSEAVAVGNVGVCGVPVELVSPSERQEALDLIRRDYRDLVVVDYTLPSAVNGRYLILAKVKVHSNFDYVFLWTTYALIFCILQIMRGSTVTMIFPL